MARLDLSTWEVGGTKNNATPVKGMLDHWGKMLTALRDLDRHDASYVTILAEFFDD